MDNEQRLQQRVDLLQEALDGAQIIVATLAARAGGSITISLEEVNKVHAIMFEESKILTKHYDSVNELVEIKIESDNIENQPSDKTLN